MYQISINTQFRQPIRPRTRCSGINTGKKENSTPKFARNGFLNHSFTQVVPLPSILMDRARVEEAITLNLKNFNHTYQANIKLSLTLPYPKNVNQVLKDINTFFITKPHTCIIKLVDSNGLVAIEVNRQISINNTLYYIDIEPYYKLKKQKSFAVANILLSIFTYLNQVCKLPHYDNSFIGRLYDSECFEEPDFIHDGLLVEKDFRTRIRNRKNLLAFERRIEQFKPNGENENSLLKVATDFLAFYKEYDHFNIQSIIVNPVTTREEEEYNVLYPDEYMSFCYGWETEPSGYGLIYTVNDMFQEKYLIASPCEVPQIFDHAHPVVNNYNTTYAERYFKLLIQLAEQLEKY